MKLKEQFRKAYVSDSWVKQDENYEKIVQKVSLDFYNWMKENDIPENAEKWFGFSNKDMFNAFKEEMEL